MTPPNPEHAPPPLVCSAATRALQEWQKGNKSLEAEIANKPAGYVGARVSKKFLTDCYARGVTRGAVECANLLTKFQPQDPLSAETIRTAQTASLVTTHGINVLNAAAKGERWPSEPTRVQLDQRDYRNQQQITTLPWWTAYANRGKDPRVHELSAFEFMRYYDFRPARHPVVTKDAGNGFWHAQLTSAGEKKIRTHSKAKLEPGKDYVIRESTADDEWITMGTGTMVKRLRHDWIIVPRFRPYVPVVYTSTSSLRQEQDQAQLLLLLFCPFTLNEEDATEFVPFICDIMTDKMRDWMHAMRIWLARGLPTESLRRWVANFCFVYFMPRSLSSAADLEENSDNELSSDSEVEFDDDDLLEATATHVRGARQEDDEHGHQHVTPQHAMTMQAFSIARRFWLDGESENASAQHRYEGFKATNCIKAQREAIAAAKASRRKGGPASDGKPATADGVIEPSVKEVKIISRKTLVDWLDSEAVAGSTNAEQHEFLTIIANKIIAEYGLGDLIGDTAGHDFQEPLGWLLHGGPGTGKTHALHFVRQLFADVVGYKEGIDFVVTTFQAVNAADVQGSTIHQAFGLHIGKFANNAEASTLTSKRLAQLRWIIIDEISMVSARLLAQLERRLRDVIPTASEFKCNTEGQVRSFAGVNIIFLGDFHQLPPPEGGFLADIPHEHRADALTKIPDYLIEAGRSLIWHGAVAGVTELWQKERCKDEWWNEVVDELRQGARSRRKEASLNPKKTDATNM